MIDDSITLLELNTMVRELLEYNMLRTYKVKAELSEVRVSAKGHCFVELIQRNEHNNTPVAKARGVIMSQVFPLIKMDFEETTGQTFCAGLQVLLVVTPKFHEMYGYSLVISDIDPTYTLGDMARKRKAILDRLKKEGVIDLNASIPLPTLIQNIAVISSPTAAGYGDFRHQLDNNIHGFRFNYKLFPATMQGEETERSIIEALNRIIHDTLTQWDAVVIIRGGGAVSDLNGFETYNLANHCAQFPIPIITGIGHERDTTVLDMVANVHLKTPTAVAAFLIEKMENNADILKALYEDIIGKCSQRLQMEHRNLDDCSSGIQLTVANFKSQRELRLMNMFQQVCHTVLHRISTCQITINGHEDHLKLQYDHVINKEINKINFLEQSIYMNDPQRILSRGYSITRTNRHAVKSSAELKQGDILLTQLAEGEIISIVK